MKYEKLTDQEYNDLWASIRAKGVQLDANAAHAKHVPQFYKLVDDLVEMKNKMSRHFMAGELDKAIEGIAPLL